MTFGGNSTHEFFKSSKKDLLMEVKDYMNNDPRRFFNFRKDNEAEKGSQGMIPAQGHCFSTFLMAWLKNTTNSIIYYNVFQSNCITFLYDFVT